MITYRAREEHANTTTGKTDHVCAPLTFFETIAIYNSDIYVYNCTPLT